MSVDIYLLKIISSYTMQQWWPFVLQATKHVHPSYKRISVKKNYMKNTKVCTFVHKNPKAALWVIQQGGQLTCVRVMWFDQVVSWALGVRPDPANNGLHFMFLDDFLLLWFQRRNPQRTQRVQKSQTSKKFQRSCQHQPFGAGQVNSLSRLLQSPCNLGAKLNMGGGHVLIHNCNHIWSKGWAQFNNNHYNNNKVAAHSWKGFFRVSLSCPVWKCNLLVMQSKVLEMEGEIW